jgi:hypothetical protein
VQLRHQPRQQAAFVPHDDGRVRQRDQLLVAPVFGVAVVLHVVENHGANSEAQRRTGAGDLRRVGGAAGFGAVVSAVSAALAAR